MYGFVLSNRFTARAVGSAQTDEQKGGAELAAREGLPVSSYTAQEQLQLYGRQGHSADREETWGWMLDGC